METSIQYMINPNTSTSLWPIFLYPTAYTQSWENIFTTDAQVLWKRVQERRKEGVNTGNITPLSFSLQPHCSFWCLRYTLHVESELTVCFKKVIKPKGTHCMYYTPQSTEMQNLKWTGTKTNVLKCRQLYLLFIYLWLFFFLLLV